MANKELTPSDIRRGVAKGRNGNGSGNGTGNGNSRRGGIRGRLNLRNTTEVPDEVLRNDIEVSNREVADELGGVDLSTNEQAVDASRFLTYLRVSLSLEGKEKPRSVSHARRYGYEDQQRKFWRDRMIRALDKA